jgi:hypothetical protein
MSSSGSRLTKAVSLRRPRPPSTMRAGMETAWQFPISRSWSWRHSQARAASASLSAWNLSYRRSRPGSSCYPSVVAHARALSPFRHLIPKIQRIGSSEPPRWSKGYLCSLRIARSFGPKRFVRSGEIRVFRPATRELATHFRGAQRMVDERAASSLREANKFIRRAAATTYVF